MQGRKQFTATCYGCLEFILACTLPNSPFWQGHRKKLQNETFLLGLVQPCNTDGKDATEETVFYTTTRASLIINLLTISSVVGRVETQRGWGIVDRSKGVARTEFAQNDLDEEDDDGDV